MSITGNILQPPRDSQPVQAEQAVMILLEGTGSPEKVYQQDDLAELAEKLEGVLSREGVGQIGGNEFGPTETTLFMFGPDADLIFSIVEPVLRGSPQCKGARAVIRHGGPGAPQNEVKI